MKKILLTLVFNVFCFTILKAQLIEGFELGLDGSVSGSNLGGAAGGGLKFGFKTTENFIFGPSIRINRSWSSFNGNTQTFSFTNWGGGLFAHGRYGNVIFGGIEAEVVQNKNIFIDTSAVFKKLVPTIFVCGGFSKEFKQIVRVNFGLYYDLINGLNSPYRNAYMITIKDPQTGQIVRRLPLIYRLTFFFPIHIKKKKDPTEDQQVD